MTLTPEQAQEIKKQLLTQVESLPNENKEQIKEHISKLNEQELEEFLKQNNIQTSENNQISQQQQEGPQECIFCSITSDKLPYYKLADNKKALAILELNPLSKGHAIVLPKEHVSIEKLPKSALGLAQKVAKKIKTKLKPEDVKIETSSFMDHAMINIIPIYKDAKLEKKKAEESELKELQTILETKKRTSKPRKTRTPSNISKLPRLSFRIP